MSGLNPDFRGADVTEVPKNRREMGGWSDMINPDELISNDDHSAR